MTIKKVEGIIVSEVDYKESSKIINILTKKVGKNLKSIDEKESTELIIYLNELIKKEV